MSEYEGKYDRQLLAEFRELQAKHAALVEAARAVVDECRILVPHLTPPSLYKALNALAKLIEPPVGEK